MNTLTKINKNFVLEEGTDVINANYDTIQAGVLAVEQSVQLINDATGAPNGLATLDAAGKLSSSQVSGSGIHYLGTWNATTNTPTLSSGSGTAPGQYYIVSVGGSTALDGITSWSVGEWVIFSGQFWQKIGGSVSSVNGKTGTVSLVPSDIPVTGFSSTNLGGALTELSRTSHNHSLSGLLDVQTSSISNGVVLQYNSGLGKWVGSTAAGGGDMLKSTYDPSNDGRVDVAETLSNGTVTLTTAQISNHLSSVSNPHGVTATQVGASVAQWNANKLSGQPVAFSGTPTLNQVLIWDGSQFTAGSAASASGGDMTKAEYDTDNDGVVDQAFSLFDIDTGTLVLVNEVDAHLNNTSNPHNVTAIQAGAIPVAEKGANNGVASLDGGGKVPLTQLPAAAGGTPDSIQKTITKVSHGFSVGSVIAAGNVLASAASESTAEVIGIVTTVDSADAFTITTSGYVSGLSGLSVGTTYFLSNTPGALEAFPGTINKPLFVADSATSGYFNNFRGISGGSSGGSSVTTIETVTPSGSSIPLPIKDNVMHKLTLSQDSNIVFSTDTPVPADTVFRSTILLNRQGHEVSFSGINYAESGIVTQGAPGVVQNLGVEIWREDGQQVYHLWQYGSYTVATPLPTSGLVSVFKFQSDANDSYGTNHLTLNGGASIISGGKGGLNLTASNTQYARIASSIVDMNNDFSVFVAFRWDGSSPTSDRAIFSSGRSDAPDPYIEFYFLGGSSQLRVVNKDANNTWGGSISIPISSIPVGDQLWKLQRQGDVLTAECLTNTSSGSGSFVSGTDYTMNQTGFGVHVKGSVYEDYWDGRTTNPIYGALFYSRAVTATVETTQIQTWFRETRGLTGV